MWDVEKAEVLASQRVLLRDLAVHGEQLVVAVENELRFLDPTTLERKRALPAPDVTRIAVSGDRIATAGRDHTVRVFDGDRLVHAMRDRRETPRAFTWRGGLLAAGFEDGTVTVWDAEAGVEIATLWGHEGAVEAIDIAADETVVTASADGTIRLWDAPRTPGGNRFLRHAAWDRAGKRLAFACLRGGVYVYDAAGELLEHVLPDQRMQAVAFTPDGSRLVCGGGPTVYVFDTEQWRILHRKDVVDGVLSIACTDERVVVGAGYQACVLDLATLTEERSFRGSSWYLGVAIRDGDVFLGAQKGELLRASLGTGEIRWRVSAPQSLASVALSPDGKTLVTNSWEAPARLWNASNGEPLHDLPGTEGWAASFSPDGKRIAVARTRAVTLFDARTREQLLDLRGFSTWVYALAFSPDGTRIIAGDGNGRLRTFQANR